MKKSASEGCCECGQPAVVHVTWVLAGTAHTAAYCEAHAAVSGVLDPHGYALLENADAASGARADGSPRCPSCDCSQRDFERQGRFGCPACYGAFAGLLPPLLTRMHRGVRHRGKIPRERADPVVVRHRIAQLQDELNDAVRAEQFEGAAQTRDTIASLKAKLLAPVPAVLPGLKVPPPAKSGE
ncbi:MAG: UvrB/UvrC motif-containing protein [Opitutales bacterium]